MTASLMIDIRDQVQRALGDAYAIALVQAAHAEILLTMGRGAEAVAKHDAWLQHDTHLERYDKLRKDPRAAALLARVEAW